ncbi:MAG: patatin family protein [Clostridia bacterium]|nr:patatin family protein [Clostridia bacterium]
MSKVGLVVEGGGMRGVYGCGVLDAFLENSIRFPYGIGVSAGAANLASFVAEQEGRNYRFYTNYAFDERYMSFKNFVTTGSFFGMDYIYTELTEVVDPINFEKLLNNEMEYYVVAVDALTSKPVYFNKEDVKKHKGDVFKASSAVPAMCKPIEIDGKLYFDGGVSDSIPVKRAIADGCDKIVAVLTRPRGYVKRPEMGKSIYSEILKDYPAIIKAMNVRHYVYNTTLDYLFKLEEEGKAFIFCPEKSERVNLISRNKEDLVTLYNEGKVYAESKIEELKKFMNE